MASLRRQQAAGCRGMVGRGYSVGVGCVGDPAEDGGTVPLRPSAPVGSLVVARELAPAGSRSDPNRFTACLRQVAVTGFGAAAQPSGSKLPRHASPSPYLYAHVYPRASSLQLVSLIPFDVSV